MRFVGCSLAERLVNPLFEVFDGGDFILSSYRDIEESFTRMRIYFEHAEEAAAARAALQTALSVVGAGDVPIEDGELPDEDWKYAYRRHFKTEPIGKRLMTVPTWELEGLKNTENRELIVLDPGMAFGTGKHETTRACLEFVETLAPDETFLDMGCGSGILSIAAKKLGFKRVCGFDVDLEAVRASEENAALNQVDIKFFHFALGRKGDRFSEFSDGADVVVANILGPLLIRFADEIVSYAKRSLIISGILTTLYPEVLAAYEARGFHELDRKTIGEWTTGKLERSPSR